MSKTVILDAETARELAYGEAGDEHEGWTVVENEEIDHSRWESIHTLVIKNEDGEYYSADYRQGLTESQDTRPWEYEKTVTFDQVVPATKTIEVTEYVNA